MKARTNPLAALLLLSAAGCDPGMTWGDGNSIIAGMHPDLWAEVEQDVYDALETTTFTVRDEKDFTVTWVEPGSEHWSNLRRFRVMLLVGTSDDWFVAEALEHADFNGEPGLYEARAVWSRDQLVTVLVLPADADAGSVRTYLPAIHERLDRNFRSFVYRRMYLTGVDSALADTLWREHGFALFVPKVYRWENHDSVFVFRNDNPDPSELIRQVAVTWAEPMPVGMQPEELLEWRARIAEAHYANRQLTEVEGAGPFDHMGLQAYQITGRWSNPPELGWPAGGFYMLRGIPCRRQNRMYLVDSWLYAPGEEHYQYVIQLENLLNTFRCPNGQGSIS